MDGWTDGRNAYDGFTCVRTDLDLHVDAPQRVHCIQWLFEVWCRSRRRRRRGSHTMAIGGKLHATRASVVVLALVLQRCIVIVDEEVGVVWLGRSPE